MEMDMEWLMYTIIDPTSQEYIYWSTTEGNKVMTGQRMLRGNSTWYLEGSSIVQEYWRDLSLGVCYKGYLVESGGKNHLRVEGFL